jgi:hypothetical protein
MASTHFGSDGQVTMMRQHPGRKNERHAAYFAARDMDLVHLLLLVYLVSPVSLISVNK